MIQVLPFDPAKGMALPLPTWMKVISQTADEVTVEGNVPDNKDVNQRNRKLQIVFKLDTVGFKRLCIKRIKGEHQRWNTKDWSKFSSGSQVLTTRMLEHLTVGYTGRWW